MKLILDFTLSVVLVLLSTMLDRSNTQSSRINWNCPLMLESCELLNGIEGWKGSKGVFGTPGYIGPPGPPGSAGSRGEPGSVHGGGAVHYKGSKGDRGYAGTKGSKGINGPRGAAGNYGDFGGSGSLGGRGPLGKRGSTGSPGAPGEKGDHAGITSLNWKQCTFKLNVNQKNGVIHTCTFRKLRSNTALHVTYQGDIHVGLCGTCCKKWEFQINGQSCSSPGSIDAVYDNLMLVNNGRPNVLPVFWHGSISGYCSAIPSGSVRVAIVMSDCSNLPSDSILVTTQVINTGRIIIQEVQASQL